MPVPTWVAKVNRKVFNPKELKRGKRPVLHHIGRTSGREYHTPLDAHPVEGGYVFIMMYGPETDWARNVLAAGEAALTVGDESVRLGAPRLISRDEAWDVIAEGTREPPKFLKVTDYLRMDTVDDGG